MADRTEKSFVCTVGVRGSNINIVDHCEGVPVRVNHNELVTQKYIGLGG